MPNEVTLCLSLWVLQGETLERLLGYFPSICLSSIWCSSDEIYCCIPALVHRPATRFTHFSENVAHFVCLSPKKRFIVACPTTDLFSHPHHVSLPTLWRPNPHGTVCVAVGEENPQNAPFCACLFLLVVHLCCSYKPFCGYFCLNVSKRGVGSELLAHVSHFTGRSQSTFRWCLRHIFLEGG